MKSLALFLIKLYQRFFTLIGYGSCRYYPTCSQYAKEQLLHNGFLKALFYSVIRILKCNQLFDGGFEYHINKLKKNQNINYNKIKIVCWYVPLKNGKYLVVKNREWKKNNE